MPQSGTLADDASFRDGPMTTLQNRSLDRGIRILEVLAADGAASLAGLHGATGLPKSTIRRLLGTLVARRLVRRSLSDDLYRANITLPVSAGRPVDPAQALIVDIAMPHVVELTRKVEWPSDMHVREPRHMRVVDSSRPLSPFYLYRGFVDQKINLFASATGQICLATLPDAEILAMIGEFGAHPRWGFVRFGLGTETFMARIAEARRDGYGTRVPSYTGETVPDDGLAAIAVPIFRDGAAVAAVTLLWPRTYLVAEDFAERYLDRLKATAEAIGKDLAGQ